MMRQENDQNSSPFLFKQTNEVDDVMKVLTSSFLAEKKDDKAVDKFYIVPPYCKLQ